MILIADSGSTKTSWVLTGENDQKLEFQTQGFNPYIQSKDQIAAILSNEVIPKIDNFSISNIYFYGAGCSSYENKSIMYNSFKNCFANSEIEIEHDLMGAARALWFNTEGIVGILGTGSNSCVYDGDKIVDSVPSLGFILGDEGSGAYMGKKLLRDFLYFKMPESIHKKIYATFGLDDKMILDQVYKKENPNRWLAGFSTFISENIHEDYCNELVEQSMRDYFEAHISQYPGFRDLPFGVVGSIGYVYRKQLEKISSEYSVNLKKLIKSPIDELVIYHLTRKEN